MAYFTHAPPARPRIVPNKYWVFLTLFQWEVLIISFDCVVVGNCVCTTTGVSACVRRLMKKWVTIEATRHFT